MIDTACEVVCETLHSPAFRATLRIALGAWVGTQVGHLIVFGLEALR